MPAYAGRPRGYRVGPNPRPSLWVNPHDHLQKWNAGQRERGDVAQDSFPLGCPEEDGCFVHAEAQQRVMPTCWRNFAGLCDEMHRVSATVAHALCRAAYAERSRLVRHPNSALQLAAVYSPFCACWGVLDYDREVRRLKGGEPNFDRKANQLDVALRAIPYRYGRDPDDLRFLAKYPQCPGLHRPDLADTNGWWPYEWREVGLCDHYAVVGSYWQNADCWAKANRALTQFPGCRGSATEFLALFQCHLYQTSLGEWNQGYPAGILQWISDVTRLAGKECTIEESPLLRFAKLMVIRTVPWLRKHQDEGGLWDHATLERRGAGARFSPLSARLATYHIAATLNEFGLLDRLRPS